MGRMPAAERREQLLDVAADLFSTQGYARTTTAQLAKAAGVTEPIIYRHFASKRDLFVALIERTGQQTLTTWEADLAEESDAAARVSRLISDNPMVTDPGRVLYRVFLQAITEVDDDEIRSAVDVHIKALHRFICRELEAAQSEGRVRDVFTAELLAWVMIDLGLGYGVLSAMKIPGHSRDSSGSHVRQLLARVMVGKKIPPPPDKVESELRDD
ncbi:MAG: TetR/AcrR family transcriptional regulator [Planctomycetota bacterium]